MEMSKFANNHYLHQTKTQNSTKVKREPMKIKYISSPLLVKASNASEFRAIVQELTGQNSEDRSPHDSDSMVTNRAQPKIEMAKKTVDGGVSRTTMPLLELNEEYLWENFSESL